MSMHNGHRGRLKERFRQEGLDHFDEIQALELLLFYAIPRQDTNPLAHRLLEQFGSLAQVMEAPVEELQNVEGMGENAATLISLTTAMGRYYLVHREDAGRILTTTEACGVYLTPFFHGLRNETVFLLCLDSKCKVLCCRKMGEGSVNSTGVPMRRLVHTALRVNAAAVVLAHNHPGGLALPSTEDLQTTGIAAQALGMVDIALADHIIVAGDDFVSLAQSGYTWSDGTVVRRRERGTI